MNPEPTWHRVNLATVTLRTDAELPSARRWVWRNVQGQLRLRSPRGREAVFQLGKKRPGAWMRRLNGKERNEPTP
jgi:hypothetical protein